MSDQEQETTTAPPADEAEHVEALDEIAGLESGDEVEEPEEQEALDAWPAGEWPAAQSSVHEPGGSPGAYADLEREEGAYALGHVVDEAEAGVHTVEHVGGEIDVPPGYAIVEGEPRGERRSVGIVVSRFNGGITNRMLRLALEALEERGVPQDGVTVMPVPGAFELPLAAMALAKTRRYACIVALGCVIRGETPHFDFVASEAASGLQLAGIETGVPVAFGVLTCNTTGQAEARIDKAVEAVESALEMADAFAQLRASARS